MLGMVVFQYRADILPWGQFWVWLSLIGIGAWHFNGPIVACTGITAALIIAFIQTGLSQPFLFLGDISYSLYLLHFPIGSRVINLGLRFASTLPGKIVVLVCALGVTIGASWLLYRFVERPAQRWSGRIRYSKKRLSETELVQGAVSPAEAPSL